MNSKIYLTIAILSILRFALIPAEIPTAFENVLAQGIGGRDTDMSCLEQDRVYPNMSSLE